jgi:CubicO group peptidase (beta-lactamase class C family)
MRCVLANRPIAIQSPAMYRWMIVAVTAALACQRPAPVGTGEVGTGEAAADEVARAPLDEALARWDRDEHGDLRAVVVRRGGAMVAERYYNGETPDGLHDVRSAGKSVTALLAGVAIDRGLVAGVDARVDALWPAARGRAIGGATLEDLLTMRAGLDASDDEDSPGNEDRLDEAADPVAFALAVPANARPGERYLYNSLTAYLTGLVIAHAAGQPLDELARDGLFGPLGITAWRWQRDAAGRTKGQGNLWLTARDLAVVGELVRQGGAYQGRRVVSEGWIRAALAPRVPIADVDPYADGYGYFWYTKTHHIAGREVAVSFASGNGGNKIYVVPSYELVVAITSRAYGRGHGQRRSEAILLALLATLAPAAAP